MGAASDPRATGRQKSLDVIEYATDLLMEEVVTEYEIPQRRRQGGCRFRAGAGPAAPSLQLRRRFSR